MSVTLPGRAVLPCLFSRFSRRLGRPLPLRPAVDCSEHCGCCPWNPEEKLRRRREGVWLRGEDGLLRLHFPSPDTEESDTEHTEALV